MTDERNTATAPTGAGQTGKIAIVLVLAAAIAGAFYLKQGPGTGDAASVVPTVPVVTGTAAPKALPRLVDLGADKCIPCKKMAPILEELRKEHAEKIEVVFIDVWKNPEAANPYNINLIPTQIFFAADGKELFRHEGFFPKEDILAKWKELGVELFAPDAKGTSLRMGTLFGTLTHAVEGTPALAVAAAVLWGVLSIILSPCHLASIPLIVGFIDEQGRISTKRAFLISLLFATGILVTIALIGAVTASAGRMMGDVGRYGNYFVAAIFFLVGLHLLDVIPMPWSGPGQVGMKRKGLLAALLLGLIFGIALGPCTFAYMAPMLGVTFRLGGTHPLYGALLLLAYGVGHCAVIVAAGTSTELVQRFLNWNENSRGTTLVKKACGLLVILGGLWMIYVAP